MNDNNKLTALWKRAADCCAVSAGVTFIAVCLVCPSLSDSTRNVGACVAVALVAAGIGIRACNAAKSSFIQRSAGLKRHGLG